MTSRKQYWPHLPVAVLAALGAASGLSGSPPPARDVLAALPRVGLLNAALFSTGARG